MIKKSLLYLLSSAFFLCTSVQSSFDFGMKAEDAQKKLGEYYQTMLAQNIPKEQLEKLTSGKGYLTLATDWFKSFFSKPSYNKLTQDEIDQILNALTERLAIYNFLFNQYNSLVNPSNMLEQVAPLENNTIKNALSNWTHNNILKTLAITDKNNKINGKYINNYFNLIVNVLNAGLEPNFKKKAPEEILLNLAKQWLRLPKSNRIQLLNELTNSAEDSFPKQLFQNITPTGVYGLIKQGFNEHKEDQKQQAPYVFLAKLVDAVFKKPKQQSLRTEVENYLNSNKSSHRTYEQLIEEMNKNQDFVYQTFGTTNNASAFKEWMDEARKGKKTNEMVEDKYGRLVPKREAPNAALYQFLEKIIEYNPLLYVGDNPILRTSYADVEDRITMLAEAFNSIS